MRNLVVDLGFNKNKEINFLEQYFTNHAMRLNPDVSKLSPRHDDWVKDALLS